MSNNYSKSFFCCCCSAFSFSLFLGGQRLLRGPVALGKLSNSLRRQYFIALFSFKGYLFLLESISWAGRGIAFCCLLGRAIKSWRSSWVNKIPVLLLLWPFPPLFLKHTDREPRGSCEGSEQTERSRGPLGAPTFPERWPGGAQVVSPLRTRDLCTGASTVGKQRAAEPAVLAAHVEAWSQGYGFWLPVQMPWLPGQ